jgi:hypothetical protein
MDNDEGQGRPLSIFSLADNNANANANDNMNDRAMEEERRWFNYWQRLYQIVRARPQFRAISTEVLREEGPNGPEMRRVIYRGGRVVEGTIDVIEQELDDRITAAVDEMIEDEEDQMWVRQRRQQEPTPQIPPHLRNGHGH